MLLRAIDRFFSHEASGGILLMLATVAALLAANSGFQQGYEAFLSAKLSVTVNGEGLNKPLILWINDGLMAIFFFLIGLELKREMLEGKLKNPRDIVLPGVAALGGMAATDIAFALGILALVGRRAPVALKVFLLTLAILDDLGAIIIIALFYTAELKIDYLLFALVPLAGLIWLNMKGAHRVAPALLLGALMWVLVLKSGVHATLAGVVTALCIPLTDKWGKSPLHALEHGLAPYVLYLIVPVFAFANAGVVFEGITAQMMLAPLPLGVALGLVIGKQAGVFGLSFLAVKTGLARLPHGVRWIHVYGVACLAGVGFTMSLFIGALSFADPILMNQVRIGVLTGSAISAILGFTILMLARGEEPKVAVKDPAPDFP